MSNIYIIGGVAALIFLGIIFVMSYIKAPPDTAYIISGIRKMPRYIIGKAGIRIPFLERFDVLSLKLVGELGKGDPRKPVWSIFNYVDAKHVF